MITLTTGGLAVLVLVTVLIVAWRYRVGVIGVVLAAVCGGGIGAFVELGDNAGSVARGVAPMLNTVGGDAVNAGPKG